MSAAQVGSSPELLRLILQHVQHDRSFLYNLCLVNWNFNDICSPILYQRLTLNAISKHSSQWRGEKLKHLLNDNLKYTKSLVGIYLNNMDDKSLDSTESYYPINEALCQILQKTFNLESILFTHSQLSHDSLQLLNKLPRLHNVTVSFNADYQAYVGISEHTQEEPSSLWNVHGDCFGHAPKYIAAWSNLTRLDLLELWGDIEPWIQCFTLVLAQSAGQIQHLGLSLSEVCHERDYVQGAELLHGICDGYATTSGNILKLKSLTVGFKIQCPPLAELQKLMDLATVEELSIFNDSEGDFTFLCPVPWDILVPEVSTSLKTLSFSNLDEDVWANLDSLFDDTRRIGLRFESTDWEDAEGHHAYDIFSQHPDSRITEIILPYPRGQSVTDAFQCLMNGSNYAVCLGLEFNKLYFDDDGQISRCLVELYEALGRMPDLSALWLCSEGTMLAKATSADYQGAATKIAKAASSLIYIRIGNTPFRIDRRDNGVEAVLLDELQDKVLCPNIFRSRYPGPWACHDDDVYLGWNEDLS